jgi:predicted MFS family arabinose efflux permease
MISSLSKLSPEIKQYLVITGNYWVFTLTDGALRMLVVLHFHSLGYSPLEIALLFLFYEIFGVITNLVGGWLGAKFGLNKTMNIGLALQIAALSMLLVPAEWLTVAWVMTAQALSGIAKDLNKMSAKSSIKLLIPKDASAASQSEQQLYKWIAILTGSKNALKGAGFFLGGVLLMALGFSGAVLAMAVGLTLVWMLSLVLLKKDMGKAKNKPKFTDIFSKSRAINYLSAARMFLFGARDVWFVVALPVFMVSQMDWEHSYVSAFMALWVIGYGGIQSIAPKITQRSKNHTPDGKTAFFWAALLMTTPALIALAMMMELNLEISLLGGLLVFGALFAVNSSLHSYLIVSYADEDGVSLDVGFYYMANAMGRLIGTVLSGWVFQVAGLEACLWISTVFIGLAAVFSLALPKHKSTSN